ncbi:hypothetical protein SCLCIDRAFT_1223603 [Scleroderma citrinum Foug A]|uniref:Uncharacterized protein n=1 Tax=Scleroderma citrinum Foug A TaxID=1036808 RepID=A0A0C2YSB3_9AGAM|nr:hypothetical protein SCLCIDRAFT_1223603 [Scleroderma citrinum Foug A]
MNKHPTEYQLPGCRRTDEDTGTKCDPPVAYTQRGRCVYWLQEEQAELLQEQLEER